MSVDEYVETVLLGYLPHFSSSKKSVWVMLNADFPVINFQRAKLRQSTTDFWSIHVAVNCQNGGKLLQLVDNSQLHQIACVYDVIHVFEDFENHLWDASCSGRYMRVRY